MSYIYALLLTTMFCIVMAQQQTEQEIENDIRQANRKTRIVLDEIKVLERKIHRLERNVTQYLAEFSAKTARLSAEDAKLLKEMLSLNTTITLLDYLIYQETHHRPGRYDMKYRILFAIKLLKQDLQLLMKRKRLGYEEICYAFARNRTAIPDRREHEVQRNVISGRSSSRNRNILIQYLNQAKFKLVEANLKKHSLIQLYQMKEMMAKSQIHNAKESLKLITKDVHEAKNLVRQLVLEVDRKRRHEAELFRKQGGGGGGGGGGYGDNIRQLLMELRKLKVEIASFSRPIQCYKEIINEKV